MRNFCRIRYIVYTCKASKIIEHHQSIAASTWLCGLQSCLSWVKMAVGSPEGRSYPGHSLTQIIFSPCSPLNDRRRVARSFFKIGLFSLFSCLSVARLLILLLLLMSSNVHPNPCPVFPCLVRAGNVTCQGKSVQCCTCFNWVHLKCSLLSISRFRFLGSSHSWIFPYCFFGVPTPTSTVTSSLNSSIWYTSTAQSGPLLLMHHSHPILAFKLFTPFPPTLFLLPLHPHHRLMLLAVSLYLLLLLPLSSPSGFFNGMPGVSEPGALNCYTLFRLIPLTLFVSRNPKAVNRITSQSATCYHKIPLLFILHTRNTTTYKKSIY